MDQSVKDAIARWPDVPAAYGWLSLDARGRWRFHPQGLSAQGGPGESITNPQILISSAATTRMTTPAAGSSRTGRNASTCGWTRRLMCCAWTTLAGPC